MFIPGTSLEAQWLGLRGAFTAVGPGSIPSRGTKTPHASWHGQKKKKVYSEKVETTQTSISG